MRASVFQINITFVTISGVNLAFGINIVHSDAAKVVPQAHVINRQDSVHLVVLDFGVKTVLSIATTDV